MPKTYRQGATGALLDEYERAVNGLKDVLSTIDDQGFVAIVDKETKDMDCVSIQSILNHVVRAGYGYANTIRKQFGDNWKERKDDYALNNAEKACNELDSMIQYTSETLANKSTFTFDDVLNNIMATPWGQKFDFEQMLEHAIVHILRHRRQIEIFQLKIQAAANG